MLLPLCTKTYSVCKYTEFLRDAQRLRLTCSSVSTQYSHRLDLSPTLSQNCAWDLEELSPSCPAPETAERWVQLGSHLKAQCGPAGITFLGVRGWGDGGEVVHREGSPHSLFYHHLFLTSCCRIVTAAGFKVCNDPQKPWVKKAINKLRRKK